MISLNDTTIRVKYAYGETDIPAKPQRIYVSDEPTLQILLSLGLTGHWTPPFLIEQFLTELEQ